MKVIQGLAEIISAYDVFVIDAWGVLHDGFRPFEHVTESLHNLMASGKKVIIATNSPSRKKKIERDLQKRGIERVLYSDIASSGELAFHAAQKMIQMNSIPKRYFYLGQMKHRPLFDELPLEAVSIMESDLFWLNTGPADPADPIESYRDLAAQALRHSVTMVCVNPDRFALHRGTVRMCAGAIAQLYEEMGGKVIYYGKPYASMYQYIRSLVTPKSTFLAIGDSLETDIQGGIEAGMDTTLVFSGITNADTRFSIRPTYTMKQLRW